MNLPMEIAIDSRRDTVSAGSLIHSVGADGVCITRRAWAGRAGTGLPLREVFAALGVDLFRSLTNDLDADCA